MARLHTETIPTSTLAATARVVDGFVTTQTDHQGITGTFTRAFTATGITQTATDGRGNTTTTHTDLAGRPLGIRKDGTWYTYGWDLTKNICEVFSSGGTILTAYTYTPYGSVTANGNVTQPIQWSSEYNDSELGLVYYNYRHYNPADGRWTGRDLSTNAVSMHLYSYTCNLPLHMYDIWGNFAATATAATVGLTISAPALVGVFVAVAIVGTVVYVATKRCSACPPPTQKPGQRLDCVPPSRSHYPCKGSHIHSWVFVMHQNPTTCQCYEKKEETVTCL